MLRHVLVVVAAALLSAAGPAPGQTILFVNGPLTTGANTGASWGDAFRGPGALQRALDAAGSPLAGAPMVEIWVARGTYVPTARTDPEEPRSATFRLRTRVQLYGGFAGREPLRAMRKPWANETILSGLLRSGQRTWHVVTTSGTDASCVLDGFVVTGGNATYGPGKGGGIYNLDGSPIVRNCTIRDNEARYAAAGSPPRGSGVYTEGGQPRFVECLFTLNRGGQGGGLWGNATLIGCTFAGNSATGLWGDAGGAYGQLVIQGCTFQGNSAKFGGGAVGGSATIFDSTFAGNAAYGYASLYGSAFTVERCAFVGNTSSHGAVNGAVFRDCFFEGNNGGYSYAVAGGTFERCRFAGNSGPRTVAITARAENCLFLQAGSTMVYAGTELINCTFLGGTSYDGVIVYASTTGRAALTNCIVWGSPTTPAIRPNAGHIDVNHSCIRGWDGSLGGTGNFGADPLLGVEGRPMALSPCIDAGDSSALSAGSTLDLLGQPRFVDDEGMPNTGSGLPPVDIGAVEFQGRSCYANCDGSTEPPVLNVADLTCFLDRFTQGSPYANCDASSALPALNIADFVCFLQKFQEGCP